MTPSLKSKLVKRLRELADGAEPRFWHCKAQGICADIGWTFGLYGDEARHFTRIVTYLYGGGYIFPPGDWGNDRRTLAGILAAYIETEC